MLTEAKMFSASDPASGDIVWTGRAAGDWERDAGVTGHGGGGEGARRE